MERTNVRERIKSRLDHLELLMNGNAHIDRPEYTQSVIESITKFWSVLEESDRDYVQCALAALEDRLTWE